MYILTILLEKKEIRKEEIVETIEVSDTVFHRYMQEVRAFLYNFSMPYELKYLRSKRLYHLNQLHLFGEKTRVTYL
jgi:hypothetical protein